MNDKTRRFPVADILTVTTGLLLSREHVDGLYRILNYLTGDNLFTHQLGVAAEAVRPGVFAQHPQLEGVRPPDGLAVPALLAWLAEQEARFGAQLPLAPVPGWGVHDPLADLASMIDPRRIVPVVVADEEGGAR